MIRDTSHQDEILTIPSGPGRKTYAIILFSFVAIAVAGWKYPAYERWSSAEHTVARTSVRLSTVARGDLNWDISATGSVVAAIKPTLFSPAIGVVTLEVSAGDSVVQGQTVARIDSPELLSLLEQESSAVASREIEYKRQEIQTRKIALQNQQKVDLADVDLVAAKRELRRAVAAHQQHAISEFDYDKARDDVATAKLRFEHASQEAGLQKESLAFELQTTQLNVQRQKLSLVELQRRVSQLQLLSPVNGIVGHLLIKNRDAVGKNQPLLTVVDLSVFEVELRVPDSYASSLQPGLSAEVSHQGNVFSAELVSISPEVINSQITTKVRFLGNTPKNLKQNQRVSARILLEGKTNTLLVERGPFLESSGGRYTYLVEDELARRVRIQTGVVSVENVEIVAGLVQGQTVIVSSLTNFNDADVIYLTD